MLRMTLAQRLRTGFALEPAMAPIQGDLPELRAEAWVPAAVLIAITDGAEPGVILTVRREHMRTHAGQIAFPGGRLDVGENSIAAALREAHEELLLNPTSVEIVGTLAQYRTVTGYVVTPVIGVIPPNPPLTPHEHEVAEWFEASLQPLLE